MKKIAIVGAGFSGAVISNILSKQGQFDIHVFDSRPHLAGNCHTERHPQNGIMIHKYGPHIFHTNDAEVWHYVRSFDEFMPFTNRVKAITNNQVYSLPINLHTINQFFKKTFTPSEAHDFIAQLSDPSIKIPLSFEEQALKFIGNELYEAFFRDYTIKQWGIQPSKLPASILKRLPIRFNYDDNYYSSRFQGIPLNGYTHIIKKMLDHPSIQIHLNTYVRKEDLTNFNHIFYSGPIDEWFNFSHGKLAYRTLDFIEEVHTGDYQGNAVINYCDSSVPWTRISEHKHFSPWESHEKTVIYKEFSRLHQHGDTPYYPIRLIDDKKSLEKYVTLANKETNTTFVGRLGTYRYLDMHVTVREALDVAVKYLSSIHNSSAMPSFNINPLL